MRTTGKLSPAGSATAPGRIFASALSKITYICGQPQSPARLSADSLCPRICNPFNCNDLDRGQLFMCSFRGRIGSSGRVEVVQARARSCNRPTLQSARLRSGGGRGAGVPRLPPAVIAPRRSCDAGGGLNFQRTTLECGRLLPFFKKACPTDQARSRSLSPHLKAGTRHVRSVESLHPYSTRETRPRATRRRNFAPARKNFLHLGMPVVVGPPCIYTARGCK